MVLDFQSTDSKAIGVHQRVRLIDDRVSVVLVVRSNSTMECSTRSILCAFISTRVFRAFREVFEQDVLDLVDTHSRSSASSGPG